MWNEECFYGIEDECMPLFENWLQETKEQVIVLLTKASKSLSIRKAYIYIFMYTYMAHV